MSISSSQDFLSELDKKLWTAANRGRWNLDTAVFTLSAVGLIFLEDRLGFLVRDQHPDLRADFVMANPPFNIKEWWDGKLEGDARWSRSAAESAPHATFYKKRGKYGTPPQGNANFAWVQHMLHHLAPNGSMALLLANGSMSSNSSGEGDIRRALPRRSSGRTSSFPNRIKKTFSQISLL